MIKKAFFILCWIIILIVIINIVLNFYKNSPARILSNLKEEIEATKKADFNDYNEWLWKNGRTFIFDVIYMNLFSPGLAKMSIREELFLDGKPDVYIIEATLEESDLFKKIYNARMVLNSAVQKGSKLPLWYKELSITPEGERSKEIKFFPKVNIAERENSKFRIPDNTYDPLSVFFNFLASDFNIGKPLVLNLLSKEEIYEFKVNLAKEQGNIYKIEGEVFRQDKSSSHGASFTAWIFNGEVRVPLLLKVVSAAGPIYLRLKDVK